MINTDRQKDVINKIIEIENTFPVNEWVVDDIKFWPFIRTSLAYTQRYEKKIKKVTNKARKNIYINFFKKIWVIPSSIINCLYQLKKADRLFVGTKSHRRFIHGKWVNIYFDNIIPILNKVNSASIMIDSGSNLSKADLVNNSIWYSIMPLYAWVKLKGIFVGDRAEIKLPEYNKFYKHILQHFDSPEILKLGFSEEAIRRKMNDFHKRRNFWLAHLSKSKIKNTYFLCYYSSLIYPLISACNKLGINTIDVQHGGMGKGHCSYDRWTKIESEGYCLLPKFFWTWDEKSKDLITQWANESKFHKAICFGTPWNTLNSNAEPNITESGRDYILYNMANATLEDYLIETFKHFGEKEIDIVLRLHPRQIFLSEKITREIVQYGLQQYVRLEDSNLVSLQKSVQNCKVMISVSSGSILEAMQMGIKPILLPSVGFDYYDEYIKEEKVLPLLSRKSSDLIELININLEEPIDQNAKSTLNFNSNFLSEFESNF